MRISFLPVLVMASFGYCAVSAQTVQPESDRNAAPTVADPDRASQHCTTTGLAEGEPVRCPDDVISNGPRPRPPQVRVLPQAKPVVGPAIGSGGESTAPGSIGKPPMPGSAPASSR